MPKIKAHAGRLKDPAQFHNHKAKEKFEDTIEPYKILKEQSFQFPKQPTRMMNNIYTVGAHRGWMKFCAHPQDHVI